MANHDPATETLRQRAGLCWIEVPSDARRRSSQRQLTAVGNRDHPLIEATAAGDDFAEAREALGRLRAPRRSNSLVQTIRCRPLSVELSFCTNRLPPIFRAMSPPEIERRARRGQRDLAENGTCHKSKRCLNFAVGAIRSRHHRDSHRIHTVDERHRG